jgi:hypothetical protein
MRTDIRTRAPPNLSAMKPPAGRKSDPARTQGGEARRSHLGESETIDEEDREVAREADETAERDHVERAQPQGVRLLQKGCETAGMTERLRWLLREEGEHRPRDSDRDDRESEDTVPADVLSEPRRSECGDDRPGVARTCDPECEALVLGWVPAAHERERHGEARARDAEQQPHTQHLQERSGREPSPRERDQNEPHREDARAFRAHAIRERAEDQTEYGAAQRRDGDHQPFLRGREPEVRRDVCAERAEQYPNHERDIEMHE